MEKIIGFLLVFSPIFTDLPTYFTFGEFGRSLTNLLSPLFLIYTIFYSRKRQLSKGLCKITYITLSFAALFILISTFYFMLTKGYVYLRGEHILVKNLKMYMYVLSFFIYLLAINTFGSVQRNRTAFFKYIWCAYIFLLIILIIEKINPATLEYFRMNPLFTYRTRLLTGEPSWTNFQLNAYFIGSFLGIHYLLKGEKKILAIIAIDIIFLIQIILTDSKMFLIFGPLNFIIINYFLLTKANKNYYIKLAFICFLLPLFVFVVDKFVFEKLLIKLSNDAKDFTSLATRSFTWYVAISYFFRYPFWGYGATMLYYLPNLMLEKLPYFKRFNLNYTEIINYIYADTENAMDIKSGFLSFGIYYGFITLTLFLVMMYKEFKNQVSKSQLEKQLYVVGLLNLFILPFFDDFILRGSWPLLYGTILIATELEYNGNEVKTIIK